MAGMRETEVGGGGVRGGETGADVYRRLSTERGLCEKRWICEWGPSQFADVYEKYTTRRITSALPRQ